MSSLHAFLRDYVQYNYSVPEIVERYVRWVSEDKYMILARPKRLHEESLKGFTFKTDYFAVKCAKRGNDVYRSRVYHRFRGLSKEAEDLNFFDPKDSGPKRTRALFVTLTYDTHLCSFSEAWHNVGIELNRFMAYTRSKFGKVSCCRVFESFENGYPHVHSILLFEETSFSVFRDKKGQFRVHLKDIISAGWHSNVDVKALDSLAGGFSYLKKYLLKNNDFERADSKALKTLALCWAFRKRAFSVSGQFRRMLSDLIRIMHNSNKHVVQVSLSEEILREEKFYVLGFVPIGEIEGLITEVWFSKLNKEQVSSVEEFLSESKLGSWSAAILARV
jgi:hypothetical protein